MSRHTYREAGVDIDLESAAIRALVDRLTYRRKGPGAMVGGVGHFAGLIELGSRVLALAVDGVGTKMLIADAMRNWRTVGIDCIAMNVNDLYVMNIEPVAFVDYIATDALSPEKMAEIGEGLNRGAEIANISIVGGETATLKGLVSGLDLAGTCLGMQERDRIVTGEAIAPGDFLVGVPSSGVHSNGFSLVRRILDLHGDLGEMMPGGRTLGEELLTPTRIYTEALEVAASARVHGMCHITGGGVRNLRRLKEGVGFLIHTPLRPQPVFSWIEEAGGIEFVELYRTFNMGMGYVYIVPEASLKKVLSLVPDARVVGEVIDGPGVWVEGIEIV
ncbi:MAG: phosphoribosylformylglycinamidine cyclo-ligase [Methanomicrobiaceae archaeon]|nr:phosphoribosylformylglycinamidine cyclo-ligase [Methanomicrobiaceae archaeon]